MANGHPPKEACNCKNELVEVAIPKGISTSYVSAWYGSNLTRQQLRIALAYRPLPLAELLPHRRPQRAVIINQE